MVGIMVATFSECALVTSLVASYSSPIFSIFGGLGSLVLTIFFENKDYSFH